MDDPDDPKVQRRARLYAWAPVGALFLAFGVIDGGIFESVWLFLGGLAAAASVLVFVYIPTDMFHEYGKPDEEPNRYSIRGDNYLVVAFGYLLSVLLFLALVNKVVNN